MACINTVENAPDNSLLSLWFGGDTVNKNHEGYHDPTAGKAIRRADRRRKRYFHSGTLTYRLSEVPGFKEIRVMMSR